MNRQSIPLLSATPGTHRELTSFHFGPVDAAQKIYIQASLHADETPAMLAAVVLRAQLAELDAQGALAARVVLVPLANPVGLDQHVLGQFIGRFDLASGRNFNRHFHAFPKLLARAQQMLGPDVDRNRELIRQLMREELDAREPLTEFDSLQSALLKLSHDADLIIDLHCSLEAVMHVYTSEAGWPDVEPLARYLGSRAQLLATDSGAQAFDEAHSLLWWELRQQMPATQPVPAGPTAVTIECRGQRDVSWDSAQRDANALIDYLRWRGAIVGGDVKPLPELLMPATPLAGSAQFYAPQSGILVHRAHIGDWIRENDPLFDIVDPMTGETITVNSTVEGVFYMRRAIRFVTAGAPLGRVTGTKPIRSGVLLGA